MTDHDIEQHLIGKGVKNLRDFGYPHVTWDNIFTDEVYSAFFANMLESNKGQSNDRIDAIIDGLITRIRNSQEKKE